MSQYHDFSLTLIYHWIVFLGGSCKGNQCLYNTTTFLFYGQGSTTTYLVGCTLSNPTTIDKLSRSLSIQYQTISLHLLIQEKYKMEIKLFILIVVIIIINRS